MKFIKNHKVKRDENNNETFIKNNFKVKILWQIVLFLENIYKRYSRNYFLLVRNLNKVQLK